MQVGQGAGSDSGSFDFFLCLFWTTSSSFHQDTSWWCPSPLGLLPLWKRLHQALVSLSPTFSHQAFCIFLSSHVPLDIPQHETQPLRVMLQKTPLGWLQSILTPVQTATPVHSGQVVSESWTDPVAVQEGSQASCSVVCPGTCGTSLKGMDTTPTCRLRAQEQCSNCCYVFLAIYR